jgi:hypothetical protein
MARLPSNRQVTNGGAKAGWPVARWLRPVLWVIGWALLALPLAREGLADIALASHRPGQALALQPRNTRALATLATALQLKEKQQQATTLALAALKREPMNVAALRTLGLAREATGDEAGATRVMFQAARLGWRDAALQLWLIKAYGQRGWYIDTLQRADALARTNKLPQVTFPVFQVYLRDAPMRAALVHEMADRPFWRGTFFYHLLELPTERMPDVARLVEDLAAAGTPITPAERDIYLTRLVQLGQGDAAYAYWLREQRALGVSPSGVLWDAGFERVPARDDQAAPFEWRLSPESAGVASIVPGPHGQQLSVSSGRDFNGTLISQTLVLAPGRYAVAARVGGDIAGLRWSLRCQPGGNELPIDTGQGAAEFPNAAVTVPAGCPAQALAIAIASGDEMGSGGQVTVDDVVLRRIG